MKEDAGKNPAHRCGIFVISERYFYACKNAETEFVSAFFGCCGNYLTTVPAWVRRTYPCSQRPVRSSTARVYLAWGVRVTEISQLSV